MYPVPMAINCLDYNTKGYHLDLISAVQSKADDLGRVFFLRPVRPEQRLGWCTVGDGESS
jgi:hypothetical protein